ncbi:hypothetical protein EMCRGX_G021007 [Ephydatia muelleri]
MERDKIYVTKAQYGENPKFYVGQSSNPDRRIEQHFNGQGATWTRKYVPDQAMVMDYRDCFDPRRPWVNATSPAQAERWVTQGYMEKYGAGNQNSKNQRNRSKLYGQRKNDGIKITPPGHPCSDYSCYVQRYFTDCVAVDTSEMTWIEADEEQTRSQRHQKRVNPSSINTADPHTFTEQQQQGQESQVSEVAPPKPAVKGLQVSGPWRLPPHPPTNSLSLLDPTVRPVIYMWTESLPSRVTDP